MRRGFSCAFRSLRLRQSALSNISIATNNLFPSSSSCFRTFPISQLSTETSQSSTIDEAPDTAEATTKDSVDNEEDVEIDDEELSMLELEIKLNSSIHALPDISEMIAENSPEELGKLLTPEQVHLQVKKLDRYALCLRRHIRRQKGKKKKAHRQILKGRVRERDALKEAIYWQNRKPGDLVYQH